MCGIAGIVSGRPVPAARIAAMADALAHRGPDGEGVWLSEDGRVAFGHRRLAIVDLSAAGQQPMESSDGRFILSFNGEIYNHAELRRELEGAGGGPAAHSKKWRGHSDTETFVEAIAHWGLENALDKAAGMFAIALWDRHDRRLRLVRDRFGEKPLYYGWVAGTFLFASELKALRTFPGFDNAISREAVAWLLERTYVPAPLSIYERIYKLEPGCILTVSPGVVAAPLDRPPRRGHRSPSLRIEPYWSYLAVVRRGLANPIQDETEALTLLEDAIATSIRGESVADVPVGAFLSSGIDSSTVVALYRKHTSGRVRTFTIGFEDTTYDEAPYARAIAQHLGTEHHEMYVTAREALNIIPTLCGMYDEPFADSSQIPTHIVSRFARNQVTVALTGDGGDELFGGYNRYVGAARLWAHMQRLPKPLRAATARSLALVPASGWKRALELVSGREGYAHLPTKIQKAFRTMADAGSLGRVYGSFVNQWSGEKNPVLGVDISHDPDLPELDGAPGAVRMMYADAVDYLSDDILCKVDRAAMAVGLETRVPFLDHRVAEVAARIPARMKISGSKGKVILRELLYREAPRELFERPKAGFGIPLGQWLRGPLRPWAEELLHPAQLRSEGYLDPNAIRARWEGHLAGRYDAGQSLWAILMFQSWLQDSTAAVSTLAAPERRVSIA